MAGATATATRRRGGAQILRGSCPFRPCVPRSVVRTVARRTSSDCRSVRSARVCMCVSAALQPTLTGHRRPTSAHLSARLQSRQSGKTPLLCTGECDGGTAERPAVGGALAEWSGAVNETAANRWGKMRILCHFALGISNGDLRGRFVVGLGRAERRSLRRKSNLRDGDKLCSCLCGALAGLPNGLDTGKECAQLWRVSWS